MTPAGELRSLGVALGEAFGKRLRNKVPMAPYTSARIGGPADYLLEARSAEELGDIVRRLWVLEAPFRILGGGSNILVSDKGMRGVLVLNQARAVRFLDQGEEPSVWAESGASFGGLARRSVEQGWSGLEWAAGIPGTVGGAVVGNAGAHGGEVAGCLTVADILQQDKEVEQWPTTRMEYAYRESWLKRNPGKAVVLSATLRLHRSTPEQTKARMAEFAAQRKQTQPTGASWGSMFKNPPGDHAGRLIEAAGLKGLRRGSAQICPEHANFIVNLGGATAADVLWLIETARDRVKERSGVDLELEVQLVGEWSGVWAEKAAKERDRL